MMWRIRHAVLVKLATSVQMLKLPAKLLLLLLVRSLAHHCFPAGAAAGPGLQ
jgi:hypothetical protein